MNYDTWEDTDGALRAINKLIFLLCEAKPSDKASPDVKKVWETEMTEVRKWAVSIHERRIKLNVERIVKR